MQLVDDGLLDIDKPIQTYLPDFTLADKSAAAEITAKMLINHTNGIEQFSSKMKYDPSSDSESIENAVLASYTMEQLHEPGKNLSYSNIGTVLAGYLAQKISQKNWYQLIQERIYEPLEMRHAIARPRDALLHRASVGHFPDAKSGQLIRASTPFLSPSYAPAGATLMMSATDLVTFARTHINDGRAPNGKRILSTKSAQLMRQRTARIQSDLDQMAYGLGWRLRLGGGVVHGGGGPGVKSQLYTYPEKNVAVAILTNSAHGDLVAKDIMRPLLEGMGSPALDRKELDIVKRAKDVELDPAPLVGAYRARGLVYTVKSDGGKLFISHSSSWSGGAYDSVKDGESSDFPLWPAGDGYFVIPNEYELPAFMPHVYRFVNPNKEGRMEYIAYGTRLLKRAD
jgi:CubicO group peptidase (beta-lactamase class C family)